MKIVVTASGPDADSVVDEKFGRCPYFILVEIEDKKITNWKSIENTSIKQKTGAGTTAAQLVADIGVNKIITGNIGPRAFDVFRQLGVDIYEGNGTVMEVVQEFIDGKLHMLEDAKCPKSRIS